MCYNHSRPQALHFLDHARGLWGTLCKRSQNLSCTAHAQCKTKMAANLDAAIASALKKAGKDENFRLKAEQRAITEAVDILLFQS